MYKMKKISKRLLTANEGRLAELLPLKFRFMKENMFSFYRGSVPVFFEDLAASKKLPKAPPAWICGDLHLENFGSYKGDNGLVYFDVNDFDEAVLAPANWEPVRLVTSIFIAFQSLRISKEKALHMARLYLKSYAETLQGGKAGFVEAKTATGLICDFLTKVARRKQKTFLQKRTEGRKKLSDKHPKHLPLEKKLKEKLTGHIEEWLKKDSNSPYNYKVVDAVFRIAGTSSIGLHRYAILLKSSNGEGDKYLLLDMKESIWPSLAQHVKTKQPAWEHNAERIFFAQTLLQNSKPSLLSTTVFNGNAFIIQEMQPVKDNINFKLIKDRYRDMCQVIDTMGMLTASTQLRSAGRKGSANAEALIEYASDPKMQQWILDYALEYASVIKKQYADFKEDYHAGCFKK
jgi:uncharacterized protein (DUF2252 family)